MSRASAAQREREHFRDRVRARDGAVLETGVAAGDGEVLPRMLGGHLSHHLCQGYGLPLKGEETQNQAVFLR